MKRPNPLRRLIDNLTARVVAIDSATGKAVQRIESRLDALEDELMVKVLQDEEPNVRVISDETGRIEDVFAAIDASPLPGAA